MEVCHCKNGTVCVDGNTTVIDWKTTRKNFWFQEYFGRNFNVICFLDGTVK